MVNSSPTLVQSMEMSHAMLLDSMDQLKGSEGSFLSLKPQLNLFVHYLLKHLQLQNDDLFLTFENNYLKIKPQSQMVEFFKMDLREIKIKLNIFMEQYIEDDWSPHKKNFRKDIIKLSREVNERIELERSFMMPYLINCKELAGDSIA